MCIQYSDYCRLRWQQESDWRTSVLAGHVLSCTLWQTSNKTESRTLTSNTHFSLLMETLKIAIATCINFDCGNFRSHGKYAETPCHIMSQDHPSLGSQFHHAGDNKYRQKQNIKHKKLKTNTQLLHVCSVAIAKPPQHFTVTSHPWVDDPWSALDHQCHPEPWFLGSTGTNFHICVGGFVGFRSATSWSHLYLQLLSVLIVVLWTV